MIKIIRHKKIETKKVAAYARVSTSKEDQEDSLIAQIKYYTQYIASNPDWELVEVFHDKGISGTTIERPGFQKLMEACENGEVNLVLTKSISRFARNTVDLLKAVRRLKELKIPVIFEKEHINTMDGSTELVLSLMASFAQEESRSISENVKWGIREKFKKGSYHCFRLFGYDWDGEKYVIVPEEAKVVKAVFDDYLSGTSTVQIAKKLGEAGIKRRSGGAYRPQEIRFMLRQEKYVGDMLCQKTFVEDPITHNKIRNSGEMPKYYVQGAFEGIISRDVYDKVQTEYERRKEQRVYTYNPSCFTSKIKCGQCGNNYHRGKRFKNNARIWECTTLRGGLKCRNQTIPEELLKIKCCEVLGIPEFDSELFTQMVKQIIVPGKYHLTFLMNDGRVVEKEWTRDWFVKARREERRKACQLLLQSQQL